MTIEQLRALQATHHARMKEILALAKTEKRNLTAEEGTEFDELKGKIETIRADIERLEESERIERELNQMQREPLVPSVAAASETTPVSEIGMSEEQVERYSLFRAINAQVTGNWDDAQFERECSLEIADRLGKEARGLYIPYEVQRAVLTTANSSALVGTDHRDDLFIESLSAESFVVGLGARVLTGLVGDVDIPKALGGISFDWIAEDDDAPETDAQFGTVPLKPKTISGAVLITRKLMKQSSPEVEKLIEADIRRGIALSIDEAVIAADGTGSNPRGILSTTGVNTVSVADGDGVPTLEEAVALETALAEDNALRGSLSYVTTPKIAGRTKTKPIDAGSGIMLNTNNQINGYGVISSSLVPAGKTIFGNFNDVVIGMWGVMDLVVDTATKASSGGLVLRVFQDIDIAVRHPESFAITV